MKQTIRLFNIGLRQTINDGMLIMLLPAHFLIGIIVKWGLPFANELIQLYFSFSLEPWYGLADTFLIAIAPLMIAMVSAFLLLDERDEGTGMYYQITPVQGYAYLTARIGFPMIWAFLCCIVASMFFGISGLNIQSIISISIIGTGTGAACAMMIVTLAGNRVEGLAIAKLTSASLLGILAVWFMPAPYQYVAAFLPSFWIGVIARQESDFSTLAGGIIACFLWIYLFSKNFIHKI